MNFRNILMLLLLSLFLVSCAKKENSNITTLRTMGDWPSPPAYNGNPYSPGGIGTASYFIYGKLAFYHPLTDEYTNFLAETITEEENKIIVKLKKGYIWNDGIPFTSKDVKGHFILYGGWAGFTNVWNHLDSIDMPDDYTIVFNLTGTGMKFMVKNYILTQTLKTPYHIFKDQMNSAGELIQLRKENKEKSTEFQTKFEDLKNYILEYKPEYPLSYMPFEVSKVTTSDMLLTKREDFMNADKITIDQIQIQRDSTSEITWSSIKAGLTDIQSAGTPKDVVEEIQRVNPKLEYICVPEFRIISLYLDNSNYPFNQLKFRQALAHILDRKKIREITVYYNKEIEYITGVLPSIEDKWINTGGFNPYEWNIKKAEKLLKELGMTRNTNGFWCDKNGVELSLTMCSIKDYADFTLIADEISRQLSDFGLNTTLKLLPVQLWRPMLSKNKFDMAVDFTIVANRHPYEGMRKMYVKEQWGHLLTKSNNIVKGPNNTDINLEKLSIQLGKTNDIEKQKEILQTLAWATNNYIPFIDIVEKQTQFYITDGKRVTGWPKSQDLVNFLSCDDWRMYTAFLIEQGKLKSIM